MLLYPEDIPGVIIMKSMVGYLPAVLVSPEICIIVAMVRAVLAATTP